MSEPYVNTDGRPNYAHRTYSRTSPCGDTCQGTCETCPNKDFFRHVNLSAHTSACPCLSCEVAGA